LKEIKAKATIKKEYFMLCKKFYEKE